MQISLYWYRGATTSYGCTGSAEGKRRPAESPGARCGMALDKRIGAMSEFVTERVPCPHCWAYP